jgi:hypothetical protein
LITTTGPLNENAGMPGHLVFPYVTDSTGYTTQFVLINPPDSQSASGIVHYFAADGSALAIDVLKLGSIKIVPFDGFNTPHAHVILNHRDAGVLTSIVGVEAQLPSNALRMYGEAQGDFDSGAAGAIRSSIALANPSDAPSNVVIEMRSLDGTLLRQSPLLQVPPSNQVALFLNQIPGFETLAAPFEGVIRITSQQGITATAFISVENETGNTLFTTTGPLSEDAGLQQLVFPHIAEGGGYTTQFVVIGGMTGQGNAGVLRFFTEQGTPLNLTLTSR